MVVQVFGNTKCCMETLSSLWKGRIFFTCPPTVLRDQISAGLSSPDISLLKQSKSYILQQKSLSSLMRNLSTLEKTDNQRIWQSLISCAYDGTWFQAFCEQNSAARSRINHSPLFTFDSNRAGYSSCFKAICWGSSLCSQSAKKSSKRYPHRHQNLQKSA